jgi:dipeptidyl aminopeptidase/acylaminoacyl peptidase
MAGSTRQPTDIPVYQREYAMFRRAHPGFVPPSLVLLALSYSLIMGCSGDDVAAPPSNPENPGNPPNPPPAASTATIAYARAGEIRLIEPDGSNDHSLWTVPRADLPYTVTGLAWKPDATEIAFSSDHEEATSFFERDLYSVGSDGQQLRKLTNGPAIDRLAALPKGNVQLTVQNNTSDGGPWFIYIEGAPEPQMISLGLGESKRLTFNGVADLGTGLQPAVAINGTERWFGVAGADVQAGGTKDGGLLTISQFGGVPHFGADVPSWRSDGTRLAFLESPICRLDAIAATPAPGSTGTAVFAEDVFQSSCGFDWGPAAAPDQFLVSDDGDYVTNGETHIYKISENSTTPGTPVATLTDYVRLVDVHWLPDGSGFIVARTGSLLDENVNLYEYALADGTVRQITTFSGEYTRRFSISPDGKNIVLERVTSLDGPSDLWVVGRDGSNPHLLVQNAGYPAWNPKKP